MNDKIKFSIKEIYPSHSDVYNLIGLPDANHLSEESRFNLSRAFDLFDLTAEPLGLFKEIDKNTFNEIFEGEGENEKDNPIEQIYKQAEYLALFAFTLGERISVNIQKLFDENEFPLGFMLDTVASVGADNGSGVLESLFHKSIMEQKSAISDISVLGYSPGYCGWHVSGQQKLFKYLHPERIDISLGESSLMTPIKSVSGVLIGGKKSIHIFKPKYHFCKNCKTHSCVPRIKELTKTG